MDSTGRMNCRNTREDAGETENYCRSLEDFLGGDEEKWTYKRHIWKLNLMRCDRLALGRIQIELKEDF